MDDSMFNGKLIIFFQHGDLITGFCESHSDKHLQVLCCGDRRVRLPVQRVLHAQPLVGVDDLSSEQIAAMLATVEEQQVRLAKEIDTEALWSALERKSSTYSTSELAREVFGAAADIDHVAAVVRALQHDHVYFKFNGESYLALSSQQVDLARERVAQQTAQRIEIERCADWLHAFANGQESADGARELCISYMRRFAVFGANAPGFTHIRSIFKQAEVALEPRECFNMLVRLGVCLPDENLLFERYGVPCEWSVAVQREVDTFVDVPAGIRCDLSSMDAWSIDDPGTRDIDDAISVEHIDGDLRVGIHITDGFRIITWLCA